MEASFRLLVCSVVLLLGSCASITPGSVADTASTNSYTEPRVSGLKAGNPYPSADNVCVSLKPNRLTKPFEVENHLLVACPKHEVGAIQDRISQQSATIVGNGKHWVVMRVSNG